MPRPRPVLERLMEKVDIDPVSGCWQWTGARSGRPRHQYGNIGIGSRTDGTRRNKAAHVVSYDENVGPVPEGKELDHLCRNTLCVNPAHLEPVTHHENTLRGRVGSHNREKTHCVRGHAFDGASYYVDRHGRRRCRLCVPAYKAERMSGGAVPAR